MLLKQNKWFRLILAMVIAPVIVILLLSCLLFKEIRLFFLAYGYFVFLVFGVPVVAAISKKRKLVNCVFMGGVIAVAPILLIETLSFSIFGRMQDSRFFIDSSIIFVTGCMGGGIFWIIAFMGVKESV